MGLAFVFYSLLFERGTKSERSHLVKVAVESGKIATESQTPIQEKSQLREEKAPSTTDKAPPS